MVSNMNENYNIRFCKNCGTERNNQEAICINCGFNFENTNQQIINPPQPEQKYCPKCGKEKIQGDLYCIECGHKYPEQVTYTYTNNSKEPEDKTLWIILLIMSILNMIFPGIILTIFAIICFISLFDEFSMAIVPFILSSAYSAFSIFALIKCIKKVRKK